MITLLQIHILIALMEERINIDSLEYKITKLAGYPASRRGLYASVRIMKGRKLVNIVDMGRKHFTVAITAKGERVLRSTLFKIEQNKKFSNFDEVK